MKSYGSGAGRPSQSRKTNKPTCEFPRLTGPPVYPQRLCKHWGSHGRGRAMAEQEAKVGSQSARMAFPV